MRTIFILVGFSGSLLLSCATAPSEVPPFQKTPPWFSSSSPQMDDPSKLLFFVRGEGGTQEASLKEATDRLFEEVTSTMGLIFDKDSEPQTEAVYRGFREEIAEAIKKEGGGSGFFVDRQASFLKKRKIITFLSVFYDRRIFESKQQTLSSFFLAQPAPPPPPLQNPFKMIQTLLLEIRQMMEESSPLPELIVEQKLSKVKELIGQISITKIISDFQSPAWHPVQKPILVRVSLKEDPDQGFEDVPIVFLYQGRDNRGTPHNYHKVILSDEDGFAAFEHPLPTTTGPSPIKIRVDISSLLVGLEDLPFHLFERVVEIQESLRSGEVVVTITFTSQTKEIPTAVLILDTDLTLKPLATNNTAVGLVTQMKKEGFNVEIARMSAMSLLTTDEDQLIEILATRYKEHYRRVIMGVASIADFEDRQRQFIVLSSASLTVVDLATRSTLYRTRGSKTAQSSDGGQAISSSFWELGKSLAEDLARNLP